MLASLAMMYRKSMKSSQQLIQWRWSMTQKTLYIVNAKANQQVLDFIILHIFGNRLDMTDFGDFADAAHG
ncbi:hypothetical protein ABTL50_19935, partial [Acinetobacter baumannii]